MNKRKHVLIVDDEETMASALQMVCERNDCSTAVSFSGSAAIRKFEEQAADLVILDIGLPDMNGLDVFGRIREMDHAVPILIITAHGNLDNAVRSRKLGADEYLVKPFELEELAAAVRRLLQVDNHVGVKPQGTEEDETLMIGAAPSMQQVYAQIAHACMSNVPVLISGPTGTGKTLCARAVHMNSDRRKKPFVNLHCSTLPEELLESELFGYEKNAFTGAVSTREGHVDRAAGGTLLLDEIADIPLSTQAKLLRFVEDKTYNRVGGREDLTVDLRLITATNKDLKKEVKQGRFREDLYYRLQVLEIALPPLHERKEDLPALCAYFLGRTENTGKRISDKTWEILNNFDWPGNVRQLKNTIERAAAVCPGARIDPLHLPMDLFHDIQEDDEQKQLFVKTLSHWINRHWCDDISYDALHEALERELLLQLLERFDNKPTIMAKALNMNRATLLKKRKRMELG